VKSKTKYALTLASSLLLYPALVSTAQAAAPGAQLPFTNAAAALDLGAAPDSTVVDVAVTLKLVNRAGLESFVASTVDRSSPNFRKFLTPAQFAARYGQPDAVVNRVRAYLKAQGLTVTEVFNNNLVLMAKGTNAQLASILGSPIHNFSENGQTYQRPLNKTSIPAALRDVVVGIHGANTKASYTSHMMTLPDAIKPVSVGTAAAAARVNPAATIPTPGVPQQYTVNDLAKLYNITPLYTRGLTGAGKTLGIMTFASFKTTDVSAYWAAVGVNSSTTRISTVNTVTGSTISASGADETTLDVEQSGGIAPGANIIVYEAPNTDAGAIALYSKAITDNLADTLSISWGESEIFYDPDTDLPPYDALFLQSAAQGVPLTAASADSGSYDVNNAQIFPYPEYTTLLAVDYPSSSPYVLGAGGTTLPVTLNLSHGTVVVPAERPWAWDYLRDYILSYNPQSYYYANLFPVGGGGGVSIQYAVPSYQVGVPGVLTSAPGQSLLCFATAGCADGSTTYPFGTDLQDQPAGFAGRNVPDVSLNADPETGYSLYYNKKWSTGSGGTSFVAPQLNGIFALISQQVGGRIGWPHPQIYAAFKKQGYGAGSPFRSIAFGSNEFYTAGPYYNPASGIGSLDIDNLSKALAP
jgi:subtilase family serine protease